MHVDPNQRAGHVDYTLGNGAEFAQDPLSLPSGPITRLRAKRFKEALKKTQKSGKRQECVRPYEGKSRLE